MRDSIKNKEKDPVPPYENHDMCIRNIHYNGSGLRLALVSHHTSNVNFIKATQWNHNEYAKIYHMDYVFRYDIIDARYSLPHNHSFSHRYGLFWQKYKAVSDLLLESRSKHDYVYDYVMWIDADAVFTNYSISVLDAFIKPNPAVEIFIAKDAGMEYYERYSCINNGVFIVKNTESMRSLFSDILPPLFRVYGTKYYPDQFALGEFMLGMIDWDSKGHPRIIDEDHLDRRNCTNTNGRYKICEAREMNSHWGRPELFPNSCWQYGDFIAHFMGYNTLDKETFIPRLVEYISHKKELEKEFIPKVIRFLAENEQYIKSKGSC